MNQGSPLSLSRSATTPDSFVQMAETWYVPGADPGFSKGGLVHADVMQRIGLEELECLPSHTKCGKLLKSFI